MNDSAEARLRRLLGGDHLASLRKRLRQRFERAPLDTSVESFRIAKLTAEEHATLASLLGRRQRYSNSLQVDVHLIDAAFQNSGVATSLRDALEQLDGPIRHLATTRFQSRTLWSDAIKGCSRQRSNCAAVQRRCCNACPRTASHVRSWLPTCWGMLMHSTGAGERQPWCWQFGVRLSR